MSSADPSPDFASLTPLDRHLRVTLPDQIAEGIRRAIREGRLLSGARLPSWQDLSTQLGVARGTVRLAYERLVDEKLLVSQGPGGTHVAQHPAAVMPPLRAVDAWQAPDVFGASGPGLFQMGVPAEDVFPAKLWARLNRRAADAGAVYVQHQDPRGLSDLRREIAAYLGLARQFHCSPDHIFVTTGFRGALGLMLHALPVRGRRAWVEEPGYPVGRAALALAGLLPVGVPVDDRGLDVARGIAAAPDAALALVTPGQQAPLGVTLSNERRRDLLAWAQASDAWIVEDDYLGDLQLDGRVAPALAGEDRAGRVVHIGTFSKTINPSVGIGFLVAPWALADRLMQVAACLMPPPGYPAQRALAAFLRDGHFLRHLRKMKTVYSQRRAGVAEALAMRGFAARPAGLAVQLRLDGWPDDRGLLGHLRTQGFSPTALSQWYGNAPLQRGLLLGVANTRPEQAAQHVEHLLRHIDHRASA